MCSCTTPPSLHVAGFELRANVRQSCLGLAVGLCCELLSSHSGRRSDVAYATFAAVCADPCCVSMSGSLQHSCEVQDVLSADETIFHNSREGRQKCGQKRFADSLVWSFLWLGANDVVKIRLILEFFKTCSTFPSSLRWLKYVKQTRMSRCFIHRLVRVQKSWCDKLF